MPLSNLRFAGLALVLVTGTVLAACESSSSSSSGGVVVDAGSPFDAASPDSGTVSTPEDAALPEAAPPEAFEGVWQGLQSGATVEVSNAAGCTVIKGSVGGTVCDECVGSYVLGDAGTASVVVKCQPLAACSVSPVHTNTGTFTRIAGGALTYFYDYGGGSTSIDVQPTQRAPGDVCRIVDGGSD